MSPSYRRDIDGLRTIAVLPVVLGHAGLSLFSGGFVGVDVFFVISGFLITGILIREIEAERFSLIGFYERRARRILPALFVVMALCLLLAWFTWPPMRFRGLGTASIATLLFASNVLFWRNASDYFAPDVLRDPLLHTWSLAVEEQFYLFFPLLLWALAGMARRRLRSVIAALVALSFVYAVWATYHTPIAAFYLIPSRIWELGMGALLALGAFPEIRRKAFAEALSGLGLLAILSTVLLLNDETRFPGAAALPPVLGALAIIWAGRDHQTLTGRLLSTKPFVAIGLISYSLYLVHWPVLVWTRDFTGTLDLPLPLALFCVVLSIVLAWLSWRFVEQPFRTHRDKTALSQRQIFWFSGMGAGALGAVAAVIVVTNGVPQRIPEDVAQAYEQAIHKGKKLQECEPETFGKPSCFLGVTGKPPEVILWGDSHAWAMIPGLEDWSNIHGLGTAVYQMPACAPVIDVYRTDNSDGKICANHNETVLAWIRAQSAPIPLIILEARWPLWIEGQRAANEAGKPLSLAPLGDGNAPDSTETHLLMEFGLERLLAALQPHADRIVILGGIPEMMADIPNTLIERTRQWRPMPQPPSLADYEERHARSNDMLRQVADKYGAVFVDLGPIFCHPDCVFQDENGILLYRDDDHLSTHGARIMVPRMMDAALANTTMNDLFRSLRSN